MEETAGAELGRSSEVTIRFGAPPISSMKLPRWRDSAALRPLVSASLRLRPARPLVGGQLISRADRHLFRN
jgi:hypothetical protein